MQPSEKKWRFLGLPVAWPMPSSFFICVIKTRRHWVRASDRHSCTSVTRSQKLLIWYGARGAFSHGWPEQANDRRGGWFFSGVTSPSCPFAFPLLALSLPVGSTAFYDTQGPGPDGRYVVCYLHRWAVFFSDSADLILGFSMMLSITLSATQDASVLAKCQQKVRKEISCNLKLITLPRS